MSTGEEEEVTYTLLLPYILYVLHFRILSITCITFILKENMKKANFPEKYSVHDAGSRELGVTDRRSRDILPNRTLIYMAASGRPIETI